MRERPEARIVEVGGVLVEGADHLHRTVARLAAFGLLCLARHLAGAIEQLGHDQVQLRIGPLSPANPLYTGVDASLRDIFPQISMSVGGALVEMMPAAAPAR